MTPRWPIVTALLVTFPVLVATAAEDHQGHMAASPAEYPAGAALAAANDSMMRDMTVEMSGNPDVDFVRMMIPHHRGAIAMAKIELEHGTNPEIRKLAEGVIAAQEAEIAEMEEWLAANGG